MTLGFLSGSRNFCNLLWVSCEVLVLHGFPIPFFTDWWSGARELLVGASPDPHASSSTEISANCSNHSGRCDRLFAVLYRCPHFYVLFCFSMEPCIWSPTARLRSLLLRVVAGHGVESDVVNSCGADLLDVLVNELADLVDKPWATKATWFFVLQSMFLPFVLRSMWCLATGQHMGISVVFAEFFPKPLFEMLAYPRKSELSNKSKSLTYTVASSSVRTSPLAVRTVVGFLDTRTVSSSAKFTSFLLSMCIETSESTTNYLSSGLVTSGAGRHKAFKREK